MKRALLVGIDLYDSVSELTGCVSDATAMRDLLQQNEDESSNYDCRLLTSPGPIKITQQLLMTECQRLFNNFTGSALFYFSGHGHVDQFGGYLVAQDGNMNAPGPAMNNILQLANQSKAREVLLILDCCFSGHLGSPSYFQGHTQLREGVTILAASGPAEVAKERDGQGVFTGLVLNALTGGGADVRGFVTAASVYSYVEQTLDAWDQRPLLKSYANSLSPLRRCKATVPDRTLRALPVIFDEPDCTFQLDSSFEFSHPSAIPENVEIFNKLKVYRNAGLLRTTNDDDMFFAAMNSTFVELTPLGKFYWRLAKEQRLRG